jgi:acid phosphatase (class A)
LFSATLRLTDRESRAVSSYLPRSHVMTNTRNNALPRNLLPVLACIFLATSCASTTTPEIPATVPELRPGLLTGYLQPAALPNSLEMLPPPPAAPSAAFAADEEAYSSTRALRNSPRCDQAAKDAQLRFPQAAENFSCALGVPITQEATPHLYMLMRRTLTDSGLATYSAKDHYQRVRPFVVHDEGSCTPDEEAFLRKDGSYPSGHSTIGWTWALILTEIAPERTNVLLERGLSFGQSRVICGVHWQSDVNEGRVMGASAVARLHADPVFRAELEEAKKEVASERAKGITPARDCAAERAALK